MDNTLKALDMYYEAVRMGVADVNGALKKQTENTINEYEKQIEEITNRVNNSNLKIKEMQTQKTTASKEYKKVLTTMISQERETIAEMNLQIKAIKAEISDAKTRMKDFTEGYQLIESGLSKSLAEISAEDKNAIYSYELWYENTGEDLQNNEAQIKKTELINQRLTLQAEKIFEVKSAYEKMIEIYGEANEKSVLLENQLLSECIAYEKLKDTAENLTQDIGYSREDFEDIAYNMNDYIKNNYSKLKEAGFSDDVIYSAARGYSGYDKYLEDIKPKEVEIVGVRESAEAIIDGLNEKFTGVSADFALNVESTVTNLITNVSDILSNIINQASEKFRASANNVFNNNYTSNYTVTASGGNSIYDSINALKNFEAVKKARGV